MNSFIKDGRWDGEAISNMVLPYIGDEIHCIPLLQTPNPDSRYWKYDAKEKHSVKEGYRMGVDLQNIPENQTVLPLMKWWQFLWSLTISTEK